MFTITVETSFEASHRITLPDGSKEQLHSHNWQVSADVSREQLSKMGLVMDFCQLNTVLEEILDELKTMNLEEIEFFAGNNPSAENVAFYIYKQLKPRLPAGVTLDLVKVMENPGCYAKFSE